MVRTISFIKKNAVGAILSVLLLTVIAIYGYALKEQGTIKTRLRAVEVNYEKIGGDVKAMQASVDGMAKTFEVRCTSLESLIEKLIKVLKTNGVGLELPAPDTTEEDLTQWVIPQ